MTKAINTRPDILLMSTFFCVEIMLCDIALRKSKGLMRLSKFNVINNTKIYSHKIYDVVV